jgi:galactitol-specific phosphotransferase system IIC component
MTPEQQKLLQETYEMSKENNKMLHAARRSAFIGGLFKMAMYAAFIILPSYFFYTNIVPMLTDMGQKAGAAQGKMQNAAGQVQNVSDTLNQYKELLNGVKP